MGQKLQVNSFYRVGIIVRDCEEKVRNVCRYFNIDPDQVECFVADGSRVENAAYRGEPLNFLTKVALVPLPNLELEYIQPMDENGPYAAFLREHGEGVQHFNVDFNDHRGFIELMDELNVPILVRGDMPQDDIRWRYYDTVDLFGTVLEQEDSYESYYEKEAESE